MLFIKHGGNRNTNYKGKVDKNNKRLNNRILKLRLISTEINSFSKKRNYAYGMP
jgi:hypothetical protein